MEDSWSNDLEAVLARIMMNSNTMSVYHKKNYIHYKGQLKYYRIPIILISGLNSVFSVGLQPFITQTIISVVNCLLALACGVIGSIELFLQIADNMEKELVSSKEFYLLGVDCFKMLNLERANRSVAGKDFLEEKYGEYTRMIQTSNLVQRKIDDRLTLVDFLPSPPPHLKPVLDVIPLSYSSSSETLSLLRPTPRGGGSDDSEEGGGSAGGV